MGGKAVSDPLPVEISRQDAVAEIALNRPERKNAITGPLVQALSSVFRECESDDDMRAVVLRGAGGSFCSGLDLKEFNADPRPPWTATFPAAWRGLHEQIAAFPKPVVACVEGYAINAGAALALSADFMIVGRGAFLQVGEVRQGVPAPMNLAWLRGRFGDSIARRVTLLGDRIPGAELERLGIAFRAVDDGDVANDARMLAAELAAIPGNGIAVTKAVLRALDLPGSPNGWFERAQAAVGARRQGGPLPSLKQ
ncbi:MAG: enoyl-CoA hydratase/isomerase family protein [Anaerolinea sp.]|nr:enoyl-CoA hydratase/isomerase family protein [Anaerolinea sp.]